MVLYLSFLIGFKISFVYSFTMHVNLFLFFMCMAWLFPQTKAASPHLWQSLYYHLYYLLHPFSLPGSPIRPVLELFILSLCFFTYLPLFLLLVCELHYKWLPHLFSNSSILFFIISSPLFNSLIKFLITMTAYYINFSLILFKDLPFFILSFVYLPLSLWAFEKYLVLNLCSHILTPSH